MNKQQERTERICEDMGITEEDFFEIEDELSKDLKIPINLTRGFVLDHGNSYCFCTQRLKSTSTIFGIFTHIIKDFELCFRFFPVKEKGKTSKINIEGSISFTKHRGGHNGGIFNRKWVYTPEVPANFGDKFYAITE